MLRSRIPSGLFTIAVDQESGATRPQTMVRREGSQGDAQQAEWASSGERIVFEAAEGAGAKTPYTVPRAGGYPLRIHRWQSEQLYSGIAVSPAFNWVAYIARGEDHRFQMFRIPLGGGPLEERSAEQLSEQITKDPTDKTQPAYSPKGDRLAFTVFWYQAQSWVVDV